MQHDAIAATEQQEADLFRNVLIKRYPYLLEADENPEDFEALDSETGAIVWELHWQEKIWWLDPDDTTSAHDGISVLVTADDYRYKTSELDLRIRSVLDKDIADPPTSGVLIGDAYIVADGATGDWAGHTDDIAVYTARGWLFREPVIGDQIYVEDEDTFYRYTVDGEWAVGPGARAFEDSSIPLSALLWDGRVQNQTTNAPPGSASVGVAYIIGSSPTGDWAGHALDLAIAEVENEFTIYEPYAGQIVYDIALNTPYRWTGSAWVSAAGAWVDFDSVFTQADTGSSGGSSGSIYSYSNSTAPTSAQRVLVDNNTITYTARRIGAKIRIQYVGHVSASGGTAAAVGVLRDSEANAIAWRLVRIVDAVVNDIGGTFVIDAADTNSHTYKIGMWPLVAGTLTMSGRRLFTIEGGA